MRRERPHIAVPVPPAGARQQVRDQPPDAVDLFGRACLVPVVRIRARTLAEERAAFERFMDLATSIRARNPQAHIYHFAPYEPAALKRLMGRHRGQGFVRPDAGGRVDRAGVAVGCGYSFN